MKPIHLIAAITLGLSGLAFAAGGHDHGHEHKPLHGGIITEVKHTLSVQGWTTQFTVDSGGDISINEGGVRTTASGQYGYNRRQRMTDIIRKVAGV